MKSMLKAFRSSLLLFLALYTALAMANARAPNVNDATTAVCAAPQYHQFDFWIGDWDVFDINNPAKVAHARIDSILGGCVLREGYQANDGHAGQSFTIYDVTRNVWHQTWMTSRGTLLEIEGKFVDAGMVLSGKNQEGEIIRGTWKAVDNGVRETAVKSPDDGKSWNPWFDIIFRRSTEADKATADPAHDSDYDKATVASLDAEYQEAVKRNDATTMERILSDDFILVTSSGKTYTKSQLIEEARSGRITYEHQEDTDKTVRLWGDTAVVTAKLWEKGTDNGKSFDHELWFSDMYRRTGTGWRYVFAQSAYRSLESP